MSYVSKQERRNRAGLLRQLAREQFWLVREMASMYVYSGNAYKHQVSKLNSITRRIGEVYLEGDSDEF